MCWGQASPTRYVTLSVVELRVLQDSSPITINPNSMEKIMSPANPNMQRHSNPHLANPENPIFQREAVKVPVADSPGAAEAVQTGKAPLPTTQTPLLNESVEPSPAVPSAEDLDAVAAEQTAAEATGPTPEQVEGLDATEPVEPTDPPATE